MPGKQYDKDGNSRNWWKKEDEEMFDMASRCFIDQYSNFVVPGIGEKASSKFSV